MSSKQHKKNSSSVTFADLLVQRCSSNEQIISKDSIDATSSSSPQQSQKPVLKRSPALQKTDRARTVEIPNRNHMGSINALHAGNRKRTGSLETMQQVSTLSNMEPSYHILACYFPVILLAILIRMLTMWRVVATVSRIDWIPTRPNFLTVKRNKNNKHSNNLHLIERHPVAM